MLLAAVLWGAGWPTLKLLSHATPTLYVMFLELVAASMFALALAFFRSIRIRNWRRLGIVAAIGIVEPGAAYFLFAVGLANTTASSATIIDALQPLVILFVARVFFGERFAPLLLPLVVVALTGTALAIGFPFTGSQGAFLAGDALVVIGMSIAAVHSVIMKRAVVEIDPLVVTAVQQFVGAFMVGLAVLVFQAGSRASFRLDGYDLILIALAGIATIATPFLLYITAVRAISGAATGVAIAFIPVSGLTLSAIFLRESLNALQIAGAAITVAALVVAACLERRFAFCRAESYGSCSTRRAAR